MELLQMILLDILYLIITSCGVILVKYFVDLANKKTDEVQTTTAISEYEKLNKYIDNAQNAISKVVLTVSQIFVDELKAHNKFTKEAQIEAKNKAVEMAKQMLSEESKNAIITLYNDLDVFLDTTIESLIKENKK